jgi:ribosomal protein L9
MLFPKGLAIQLTPKAEKEHKDKLKRETAHKRGLVEDRHRISDELNGQKLEFILKTGANHKVYGGI